MPTRREQTRAATVAEIKDTALALVREHGTIDVRFSVVARSMNMTAPGMYRYFANRDDLVTDLLEYAYSDLADTLEAALTAAGGEPGRRLAAVCGAYRAWAVGDPTRFALVFGLPLPGYAAPVGGSAHQAAQRAFAVLASSVLAAGADDVRARTQASPLSPAGCAALRADGYALADVDPQEAQALLHAWAGLHGFVSLEAFGHLTWNGSFPADEVFANLVLGLGRYLGLPAGPGGQAGISPR